LVALARTFWTWEFNGTCVHSFNNFINRTKHSNSPISWGLRGDVSSHKFNTYLSQTVVCVTHSESLTPMSLTHTLSTKLTRKLKSLGVSYHSSLYLCLLKKSLISHCIWVSL
jgi:hypothetical protein